MTVDWRSIYKNKLMCYSDHLSNSSRFCNSMYSLAHPLMDKKADIKNQSFIPSHQGSRGIESGELASSQEIISLKQTSIPAASVRRGLAGYDLCLTLNNNSRIIHCFFSREWVGKGFRNNKKQLLLLRSL